MEIDFILNLKDLLEWMLGEYNCDDILYLDFKKKGE